MGMGSWFVLLGKLDHSTPMMMLLLLLLFSLRAVVGVQFLAAALPLHGAGALFIGWKRGKMLGYWHANPTRYKAKDRIK
jgi:hypothetical protein